MIRTYLISGIFGLVLFLLLVLALTGCAGRCSKGKTLVKVNCKTAWMNYCSYAHVSRNVGYTWCVPMPYEACKEICQ